MTTPTQHTGGGGGGGRGKTSEEGRTSWKSRLKAVSGAAEVAATRLATLRRKHASLERRTAGPSSASVARRLPAPRTHSMLTGRTLVIPAGGEPSPAGAADAVDGSTGVC